MEKKMCKKKVGAFFAILLLIFIFVQGNFAQKTSAQTHPKIEEVKNLLSNANSTLKDECFNRVYNILLNGAPSDLGLLTNSYLNNSNFTPDNLGKLEKYIFAIHTDATEKIIWGDAYDECATPISNIWEATSVIGPIIRTTLNYLGAYSSKLDDATFNKLETYLENIGGELEKQEKRIEDINFGAAMGAYIPTSMLSPGCEPTDCLCQAAEEDVSLWSPGTWIRGIIAAIAIGTRAIMGWIANAFVWAFTGLPQRLGGYIHFKPIYDYDPATNTSTGMWKIMRDYANLGIVIAMIFMAIATILRIEKYSWKKMLPKLLLVALLINFSLVILGIFVDLSNFLSMHFLSSSTNNLLGNTIQGVVTNVSCSIYYLNKSSFVTTMTAVSLAIILGSIFIFQFAGLLFYVISRIITIWVCAAISPLAFLGMAFDVEPIKKAVNMWRNSFTQAITSLPILSFTLYFVLSILGGKDGIVYQINAIKASGQDMDFILLVAYAVVIIGLAQVLRIVAKSIGIKQIEQGYAFAQKAVTGAVMAGAAMVGGAALTGIAGSQAFRKIGQGLTQVPVLNKVGYKMLDQSDAARFTNIRKAKEKIKNWTKPEIMAIAEGTAPLRTNKEAYATYMAARSSAMEKGWIKHDSKAIEAIRKDIKNNNPDLNAKEIASAFPAMFKINKDTGKLELIDPKDVKAVAANIKKLSPEDMPKHTEEIIKAIKEAGGDIDEFFKEMAFAKTNQLRVFLDNVAEDEYTTGEVFGGDTKNPQPWAGEKGQIATMLKELETKAQIKFQDLTAKQVMGQATPDEVKDAEQEFYKAQDAVIELNKKLQSSRPLQETLNTHHI